MTATSGLKIENGSCDPDYDTGWFVIHRLGFDTVYTCAKFDDSSFSGSKNIIWGPKLKVGHVTLTTPLLSVICHSYAGT